MSDIVDETVTSWWSEISSRVGLGLNDEKPLSSYVNVSDRPADETYKVVNFEWVIADILVKPEDPPPEDYGESLQQAHPTALGAYRVSHTTEISLDTQPDLALGHVKAFAKEARGLERKWVLWLLKQHAKGVQVDLSNSEAVRKVMGGGSYRLISSVDAPNLKGIVSEQIAVPPGIEIYGLLVRSDGNGPLVTRVGGGDISPTWCRSSTPEKVNLRLTSTFFLEHPEQTLNCEHPPSPTPATITSVQQPSDTTSYSTQQSDTPATASPPDHTASETNAAEMRSLGSGAVGSPARATPTSNGDTPAGHDQRGDDAQYRDSGGQPEQPLA